MLQNDSIRPEKVLDPAVEHRCSFCGESLRNRPTEKAKIDGEVHSFHLHCKALLIGEENVRGYQRKSWKWAAGKWLLLVLIVLLATLVVLASLFDLYYLEFNLVTVSMVVVVSSTATILINRIIKL